MSNFATGKHALGICDRCGFEYMLKELREQIINQKPSGWLVCDTCMDVDHPQLQLGRTPIHDPQALWRPSPPDNSDRAFFGWNPLTGIHCHGLIGKVTVTTS